MELNMVATGIELVGTTIKRIDIENNIVDVEREAKRSFKLNIEEPRLEKIKNGYFAQVIVEVTITIEQSEKQTCKFSLAIEGAFVSSNDIDEEGFKQLVCVNGSAALIGIARGKIESISASVFNNGKVVIPFVNVVEYYKEMNE